jgi:Ankyrin repeats (3 copies)
MSERPPTPQPPDDVDEQYRRASALDPGRPSEAVRRAVLAHASRLAAERAAARSAPAHTRARSSESARSWWRPAIFGTLAAAALAGLAIAPRFLAPTAPSPRAAPPRSGAASDAGEIPAAPAPGARAERQQSAVREPSQASTLASADSTRLQARAVRESDVQLRRERTPAAPPDTAARARPAQAAESRVAGPPAARPAPRNQALSGAATSASRAADGQSADSATDVVAFRRAAEAGDLATLEALLRKQIDVNSRDAAGRTALMLATQHGHVDAVAALLSHGADPNATDAQGATPLQSALATGQWEIAATLKRYGAR